MITRDEFNKLTKDQRDSIRDQVIDKLDEYLATRHGITNLRNNFRCPVCGHDNDAHYYPSMKKTGKPGIFCYSGKGCKNKGYDTLSLIGIDKGYTDYNDKLYEAANYLSIIIPAAGSQGSTPRSDQGSAAPQQPKKKYDPEGIAGFVRQSAQDLDGSKAAEYMQRRGFDLSFLQEMRIGYDAYNNAVVIPYSKSPDPDFDYYVMRYIEPKKDEKGKLRRFKKPKDITEPVFHAENIANEMPYVFVTEGQIDALSIEQAGGNAVALGSTNNTDKLISLIEEQQENNPSFKHKKTFIVAFDHDKAGIPAEKDLIGKLLLMGYMAVSANDAGLYEYTEALKQYEAKKMQREREEGLEPKPIKDINEILQGDPDILTARIEKLISKPEDVYKDSFSMGSFRSKYQKQREENRKQPRISTGFRNLDKALSGGIRPTLIFLGAITSIGKSTLVMQIADNIAKQGKDVLIFALEMSRFELGSRSISRESFRVAKSMQTPQPGNALTYYEIADGLDLSPAKYSILQQAEDYYFTKIAPHIYIIEGEANITTEVIRQQVQTHTQLTGSVPVVIVDYLQLLQPPKGANKWSDKQIVDHNTEKLKHISRNCVTPVISVISLNRESYNRDVDLSSGKESGAIEYGCDILLGLNLESDNEDDTRDMYLDILKHRGGKTNYRITFKYTPAYSCFEDKALIKLDKKKKKKEKAQPPKGSVDAEGFVIG